MHFKTTDGTRLAYEDYGQGEPIVFVASAMLCADMWEYQIPYFVERGYRCIALDRRGHGRSDRPSAGYDVETGADDLAALAPWAVLQCQRSIFHTDQRAALGRITVPALVIHGAADFSAPIDVTGRRTARLIPGATYREYPTAGHGLFASHQDQLNNDLLEFLKS